MPLVTANQFQLQPNTAQAISSGLSLGNQIQQARLQPQINQLRQQAVTGDAQALTQLASIAPGEAQKAQQFLFEQQRSEAVKSQQRFESVVRGAVEVKSIQNPSNKLAFLKNRKAELTANNLPTSDTDEAIAFYESGDIAGGDALIDRVINAGVQTGFLKPAKAVSSESAAFNDLIKDFTPEQQVTAKKVKAGLVGRAVSNAVLSAIKSGDIQNLADAKATIKQAEKFGELTGSSRAKAIDSGISKIQKINVGISNIDKAIELVKGGAGTGAIERNFPSIKASTVALNNLQSTMALDVIGAVTFGALSQGELDLAKTVALNTSLDGPELIADLEARKVAQEKLRNYFNEQIQFLDQGGTVAGFLREKERQSTQQNSQVFNFDAQGNLIQ
jgi:hypothetical protein